MDIAIIASVRKLPDPNIEISKIVVLCTKGLRTLNEAFFHRNPNFWTWADKFRGIWGIFGQTIITNFGNVSPLSMFSLIQPLFSQKTKPLYPHPKYFFGM